MGPFETRTLAEVQRQEEEKSAIAPDTDAVPMRRWRTDSIIEEASQYHPDRARSFNFHLLTEALGSQDPDFIWGLVSQLSQASTRFNNGEGLNFMLSAIKNIHPRDGIEAMLGAQMAALHMSMMNYVDEFARLAGGEQKLTVRHVSVSQIVGTATQAPRDVLPEKTPNATPALTDARRTAMEIVGERKRKPVPQRPRHTDD